MTQNKQRIACCLAALLLLTATACSNRESSTSGDVTDLSSSLSDTAPQESTAEQTQPAGGDSQAEDSRDLRGTTGAWQSEPPTSDGSTAAGGGTQTAAQTVYTDAQGQTTASGAAQTTAASTTRSNKQTGTVSTLYGDSITAKAGAKHVPVTVSIRNNPGIAFMGIRMIYDPALTPVFTDGLFTEYLDGTVTQGISSTCAANVKKQLLGYSAAAGANLTADGSLFTCYFDLPADSKPGTVYQFRLESKEVSNSEGTVFEFEYLPFTLTVQ